MTTTTENMPGSAAISAPIGRDQSQDSSNDPYSYMLLLRFALLNIIALALLIAAWGSGLVSRVVEADSTHLVLVIAGVFVIGLILACWHVLRDQPGNQPGKGALIPRPARSPPLTWR